MSAVKKAISDLIRKHALQCEQLTSEQLAEAMKQALHSGDFTRHVMVESGLESAQAVSYIPFRERSRLEAEILRLRDLLSIAENALGFIQAVTIYPHEFSHSIGEKHFHMHEKARDALAAIRGAGKEGDGKK